MAEVFGWIEGNDKEVTVVMVLIEEVVPDPGKDEVMDVMLHGYCDASATEVEQAVVLVQLHEGSEPLLFCLHHWHQHQEMIEALDPHFVINPEAIPK